MTSRSGSEVRGQYGRHNEAQHTQQKSPLLEGEKIRKVGLPVHEPTTVGLGMPNDGPIRRALLGKVILTYCLRLDPIFLAAP